MTLFTARIKKTVAVETNKVLLKESGVNLTLTIVDTPGKNVADTPPYPCRFHSVPFCRTCRLEIHKNYYDYLTIHALKIFTSVIFECT